MSEEVNQQEMIAHIAKVTKADKQAISLVLKHEQNYIKSAKANAQGEVDIDIDDLVDYVLARPDVKLSELTVETILETEMDYYMDKGLAGYID